MVAALRYFTYVKETYDATITVALAAGSLDGAAIRDHLRDIGSPPGQVVPGTRGGVAEALRLLAAGRQVDYAGVATTQDCDDNGDLRES